MRDQNEPREGSYSDLVDYLRAEINRLRFALIPFAEAADEYESEGPTWGDTWPVGWRDLTRARDALNNVRDTTETP
jgi:hypothetical protein